MLNIKLNEIKYEEENNNMTIFQFCFKKGISLPCFCYHEKLSIAGNCRMCIVQINQGIGVSCALNLMDEMIVNTDNQRVRDSREYVLEFLLSNHPLDCPICDQGGECDLQDLSLNYGTDRGRFYEKKKRAVTNLSFGLPLIKTIMTRCIHCTRCVRFATEIGGFPMGLIGRGLEMEIGNYIEVSLDDELSGNIIDLCPVGALTSMPYAFKVRPWELNYFSNIDFLDALASSLRLYVYFNKVKRVLPILDELINEDWLTNKARFSYDSLHINRLNYPKVRIHKKLVHTSWIVLMPLLLKALNINIKKSLKVVVSSFLDLSSGLCLKKFFNSFGCSNIYYINVKSNNKTFDFKFLYLFNNSLLELEKASFILFISTNLRLEAPLLNARIRKNYINNNNLLLFSIGLSLKYLTYPVKNLGNNVKSFFNFYKGKSRFFCNLFFKNLYSFTFLNKSFFFNFKPLLLLGFSIIQRADWKLFFFSFFTIPFFRFFGINFVSRTLGFLSFNEIVLNGNKFIGNKNVCYYFLNEDSTLLEYKSKLNFYIFQGFINPKSELFSKASFLIPSKGPFESDCLFLNLEGRFRFMKRSLKTYLDNYENYEIFNLLNIYNKNYNLIKGSILKKFNLCYNFFFKRIITSVCRFFFTLSDFYYELFFYNAFREIKKHYKSFLFHKFNICYKLKASNINFFRSINNYYSSDYYLRNSKIMSLCSLKTYTLNW